MGCIKWALWDLWTITAVDTDNKQASLSTVLPVSVRLEGQNLRLLTFDLQICQSAMSNNNV